MKSNNEKSWRDELSSVSTRFKQRYPRAASVIRTFTNDPLSGDTLRSLVKGREGNSQSKDEVVSLMSPVMWQNTSPIVISHFVDYSSSQFVSYWNTVLPNLQEQYGDIARYEHHDAPPPNPKTMSYQLATVSRAIQHQEGNDGFWLWLDHVMVEGVDGVSEAIQLAVDLDLDVNPDYLNDAVEQDLYGPVIGNDIDSLLMKMNQPSYDAYMNEVNGSDEIFVVFVNGRPVQPSFDSIVGVIQEIVSSNQQSQ